MVDGFGGEPASVVVGVVERLGGPPVLGGPATVGVGVDAVIAVGGGGAAHGGEELVGVVVGVGSRRRRPAPAVAGIEARDAVAVVVAEAPRRGSRVKILGELLDSTCGVVVVVAVGAGSGEVLPQEATVGVEVVGG